LFVRSNGEVHNLYSSPNTPRILKSWWMRLVGHAVCMEGLVNSFKILFGNCGRRSYETDGRIIL
jgi:hypothetical protein